MYRSCCGPALRRRHAGYEPVCFLNCFFLNCFCWIYWSYKNQNIGYRSESHKDACISSNMDQVVDASDNGLSAAQLPSQCQFDWCYCLYYLSACLEQLMAEIYWSFTACVITWLCTDSSLQDCYIVLMITSNHPTHSNTGAITVAGSSCTHSFPHNDPMHGFGDECVQYYSPPQSCARV